MACKNAVLLQCSKVLKKVATVSPTDWRQKIPTIGHGFIEHQSWRYLCNSLISTLYFLHILNANQTPPSPLLTLDSLECWQHFSATHLNRVAVGSGTTLFRPITLNNLQVLNSRAEKFPQICRCTSVSLGRGITATCNFLNNHTNFKITCRNSFTCQENELRNS